jgi:hypothetical protein
LRFVVDNRLGDALIRSPLEPRRLSRICCKLSHSACTRIFIQFSGFSCGSDRRARECAERFVSSQAVAAPWLPDNLAQANSFERRFACRFVRRPFGPSLPFFHRTGGYFVSGHNEQATLHALRQQRTRSFGPSIPAKKMCVRKGSHNDSSPADAPFKGRRCVTPLVRVGPYSRRHNSREQRSASSQSGTGALRHACKLRRLSLGAPADNRSQMSGMIEKVQEESFVGKPATAVAAMIPS